MEDAYVMPQIAKIYGCDPRADQRSHIDLIDNCDRVNVSWNGKRQNGLSQKHTDKKSLLPKMVSDFALDIASETRIARIMQGENHITG